MKELISTTVDCGALGEALPAMVSLEYFPETDKDKEHIELLEVVVKIPSLHTEEYIELAFLNYDVLDTMPLLHKIKIKDDYLDQFQRKGEEK